MKIIKKEISTWIHNSNGENPYRNSFVSRNVDGEEILVWMRKMAKIKAFGLYELPKWKGEMLARFIDVEILKDGCKVVTYVVMPDGLKRNYIYLIASNFQNDGSCGLMGATNEASLQRAILKYKDGKRVNVSAKDAIQKFINRFIDYKNQGGHKVDPIQIVLNKLGAENLLPLPKNYTLKDVEDLCRLILNNKDFKKPINKEFVSRKGLPVEWYDHIYHNGNSSRRWRYIPIEITKYSTF